MLPPKHLPTPDALASLLRERRTIHDFKATPVPDKQTVLRALDSARWAPNHRLSEPWRFYWVGPQTKAAIIELNTRALTATKGPAAAEKKAVSWREIPGWLVVTCQKSADPLQAQEDYAACACAIHNFSLSLFAEGIGSKWSTGPVTREAEFYDLLWIDPEAEQVVGLLWYGYAADVPQTGRKALEQCLVELP